MDMFSSLFRSRISSLCGNLVVAISCIAAVNVIFMLAPISPSPSFSWRALRPENISSKSPPKTTFDSDCIRAAWEAATAAGGWESSPPSECVLTAHWAAALTAGVSVSHAKAPGELAAAETYSISPTLPARCLETAHFFLPHIARSLRWWPRGSISNAHLSERESAHILPDTRIKIINGAVYYKRVQKGYKERPSSMLRVLLRAVVSDGHFGADVLPPDVDMLLSGYDSVPTVLGGVAHEVAPLLNTCELSPYRAVAVPDMAFATWEEAGSFGEGSLDWANISASIIDEAQLTPYSQRISRVVFRGGLLDEDRFHALPSIHAHPELFDAGFRSEPYPFVEPRQKKTMHLQPLKNLSHWAANLYMSGNGYSARLKYLLLTGSPVIILGGTLKGDMREFYALGMLPYVHFVPATHGTLIAVASWLLNNPAIAESIGAAGSAYARLHLSPIAVSCWWRTFLGEYAARLRDPVVAPSASYMRITSATANLRALVDIADEVLVGKKNLTGIFLHS